MIFGILFSIFCLSAHADTPAQNSNTDDAVQQTASMERQYSKSSVSVVEVGRSNSSAYGTGTVFKLDRKVFVLTAAHVVEGVETLIIRKSSTEVEAKIVYYDEDSDIAVLSLEDSADLVPISTKFRRKTTSMGESVFYCGFPNRKDIGCFTGIISHSSDNVFNIHSYAWMGASGSAVLDRKGRIVGVLSAVEVGMAWGMPQIVEDVVWVRALDQNFWDAYDNKFAQ